MDEWVPEHINPENETMAIQHYLGKSDAILEWTQIKDTASLFLPTKDFEDFKQISKILLLGLRGAGKTAMINMLNFQIQNNYVHEYSFATIIDQEEAYYELAINIRRAGLRDLPMGNLIFNLKKKWKWIIITSVMQDMVNRYTVGGKIISQNDEMVEFEKIISYLIGQNLVDSKYAKPNSPTIHAVNILSDELIKDKTNEEQNVASNININDRLYSAGYDEAKDALIHILAKRRGLYLVMIDSIESYDISDKVLNAITLSFIEAALQFYKDLNRERILVKIAFPLEVFLQLNLPYRDKLTENIMLINWQYKDLLILIAKRYWHYLNMNTYFGKLGEFEYASDFFYRHFPEKIASSNNKIKYDTFGYILRHTQLKPRQVISIFNSILTFAARKKGIPPFKFEEEHIKIGTHAVLSELALGTLNLYEQMYTGFKDFVIATFTTVPQHMPMADVDDLLANSSDFCPILNFHKKKQLLFECGVLGLCINRIDFSDREIVESLFEYLTHESLYLTGQDSIAVIHPMFYRLLRTKLNPKISVLPGRLRDINCEP